MYIEGESAMLNDEQDSKSLDSVDNGSEIQWSVNESICVTLAHGLKLIRVDVYQLDGHGVYTNTIHMMVDTTKYKCE